MDHNVYERIKAFKKKYPMTIAWRIKKHSLLVESFLNNNENVLYAFVGQKNNHWYDIISTHVFVITNKRLIVATKRVVFGYFLYSITPDMFNDLSVYSGLLFGNIEIDTVKEEVYISNLDKNCLDEIETNVTEYIIKEKKKFRPIERN